MKRLMFFVLIGLLAFEGFCYENGVEELSPYLMRDIHSQSNDYLLNKEHTFTQLLEDETRLERMISYIFINHSKEKQEDILTRVGALSFDEIHSFLEQMLKDLEVPEHTLEFVIHSIDKDGDELIQPNELKLFLKEFFSFLLTRIRDEYNNRILSQGEL